MTGIASLDMLVSKGCTQVTVDEAAVSALESARQAAALFFALPLEEKQLYSDQVPDAAPGQKPPWEITVTPPGAGKAGAVLSPALGSSPARLAAGPREAGGPAGAAAGLDGYRAFGTEFSVDDRQGEGAARQPDQCESFIYWGDDPRRLPRRSPLAGALHRYWKVAAGISADLLARLADRYRYPYDIDFAPCSYAAVNSYPAQPAPEFMQTTHEDGHLVTIVFAAGEPGLEIEVDGTMRPWQGSPATGIIMAGSLLTAMTGGEIPPAYHRVRNHRGGRLALAFFLNLPFTGYVAPYVDSESNLRTDLAGLSARNCGLFGKPSPARPA